MIYGRPSRGLSSSLLTTVRGPRLRHTLLPAVGVRSEEVGGAGEGGSAGQEDDKLLKMEAISQLDVSSLTLPGLYLSVSWLFV